MSYFARHCAVIVWVDAYSFHVVELVGFSKISCNQQQCQILTDNEHDRKYLKFIASAEVGLNEKTVPFSWPDHYLDILLYEIS